MKILSKNFYDRAWLKSLFLGIVTVGALPPYFILPCLFVGFSGLLWLLNKAETRQEAAKIGFAFGFGYFSVGLAWVSRALLIEDMGFTALAPFPPIGFGLWGGLFPMLAALIASFASRGLRRIIVFSGAWVLTEMLRAWFLTGFPWNLISSVWANHPVMMQSASIFGAYGLGLVTVFIASIFALTSKPFKQKSNLILIFPVVLLSVMAGFGFWRLNTANNKPINGVLLRLVQANIPQGVKWNVNEAERNLMKHVHLSREKGAELVTDRKSVV